MPADARGDARRRGQNYGSSASFGPANLPGFAEGVVEAGQRVRVVDVTLLPGDDPYGSWVVTLQGDVVLPAAAPPTTPLRTTAIVSWGTGGKMNTLECDWLGCASLSLPGTTCTVDVMVDAGQTPATLPVLLRASATCQRTVRGTRARATRTVQVPLVAAGGTVDIPVPRFARAWSLGCGEAGAVNVYGFFSTWDFHSSLPFIAATRVLRVAGNAMLSMGGTGSNNSNGAPVPGGVTQLRYTAGGGIPNFIGWVVFHLDAGG